MIEYLLPSRQPGFGPRRRSLV